MNIKTHKLLIFNTKHKQAPYNKCELVHLIASFLFLMNKFCWLLLKLEMGIRYFGKAGANRFLKLLLNCSGIAWAKNKQPLVWVQGAEKLESCLFERLSVGAHDAQMNPVF